MSTIIDEYVNTLTETETVYMSMYSHVDLNVRMYTHPYLHIHTYTHTHTHTHTHSLWKEKCRECGIDESIFKTSAGRRPPRAIVCNPWKQVHTLYCELL